MACLAVAPVQAQVVYVDASNTTGTQDGNTWSTAFASLQNALDDAAADEEIWIADGLYYPDEGQDESDNDFTESFSITGAKDGVEIYGGFSGDESTRSARQPNTNRTILSGDIDADAGDADTDTDGNGIPDDASALNGDNSDHVLFLDGATGDGPVTGETVIDGVIVTAGEADKTTPPDHSGAALFCKGTGAGSECSPTLRNVVFVSNIANNEGAGIYNNGEGGTASPTIANVLFARNASANEGGAVYNDGVSGGTASPTIVNTLFYANRATYGGGIYNEGDNGTASPRIVNTTFTANNASTSGGAIANGSPGGISEPEIQNTILWGNKVGTDPMATGAEMYNDDANPVVANSIVQGGESNFDNTGATVDYKASNEDVDPLYSRPIALAGPDGKLATGDDGLAVLPQSPALDAGDPTVLPSDVADLDYDGDTDEPLPLDLIRNPREQDSDGDGTATVSIGAYEGRVASRVFRVEEGNATPVRGQSWATAYPNLQDALDIAVATDEIWIAQGEYFPDNGQDEVNGDATESFTITGQKDGLEIYGGFESGDDFSQRDPWVNRTVLSGDLGGDDDDKTSDGVTPTASDINNTNTNVIFALDNGGDGPITEQTVIDGVTITGGQRSSSGGAGLLCLGGSNGCSPVIRNVKFAGNDASTGGALLSTTGPGTVSSPKIINTAFTGNRATTGGAIYNDGSSGTSSPPIVNGVFVNNSADNGGAIYNDGTGGTSSNPPIVNSVFVNNSVSSSGGAIYNDSGTNGVSEPRIKNTILWGNTAPTDASGKQVYNNGSGARSIIGHSIVEKGDVGVNGGNGGDAEYLDDSGASVSFGESTNLNQDPLFVDTGLLAGNDGVFATVDDGLNLGYDSPAFDAGTNDALDGVSGVPEITTDLTGASRAQDLDGDGTATVNIGAYEPVKPASPIVSMKRVGSVTGAGATGTVNPRGADASVQVRVYPAESPNQDTVLTPGTLTGGVTQRVEETVRSLASSTTYTVELTAENTEGGPVTDAMTFETPPAPALNKDDDGKDIQMTYTRAGEGALVTNKRFYARMGGEADYQSLSVSTVEGFSEGTTGELRLSAQLPGSMISTRGVDYYAVVEEDADRYSLPAGGETLASNRPLHLPVSFDQWSPPDSVTFAEKAYRMVSVPALGDIKTKLTESLGDYDPVDWRALQWDAGTEQYKAFPDLSTESFGPGRGFWVVSRRGLRPSLSGGTTVDASRPSTVPLKAGWNQIGNPFGFAVPWDTVRAASGLSAESVDGPFAYREGTYERAGALVPWGGYFVFSAEADTLVVPPVGTNATAQSATRAKADVSKGKEDPYTLTVEAASGAGRGQARLAVRADAKTGRGAYDQAQPPSVRDGVQLSALEEIGDKAVAHAQSAKPLSREGQTAGQTWTLRLAAPAEEKRAVRLQWREKGTVPKGGEVYLLDQTQERRLREGAELELEAGETRRLKAIVGTRGYAEAKSEGIELSELETGLRAGYPNPFEEAATIEYVLSEKQDVTIEVYDVLGRRVRTLVDGKKEAGVRSVRWAGKSRQGVPVGSGMYFVQMRAADTEETKKLVRVR